MIRKDIQYIGAYLIRKKDISRAKYSLSSCISEFHPDLSEVTPEIINYYDFNYEYQSFSDINKAKLYKDRYAQEYDLIILELDNSVIKKYNMKVTHCNINKKFLGYELVVSEHNYFSISCSWICNNIDISDENFKKLNNNYLFQEHDECEKVLEKIRNGSYPAEPGFWLIAGLYSVDSVQNLVDCE